MDKNLWVWHREVSVLLFSFLNSFTQVLEWFISSSSVDIVSRVLLSQSLPFSMMDGKHHLEKLQLDPVFAALEWKSTWEDEQQNCFQDCPLPVLSPNPLSCVLLCVFLLTSVLQKIVKRTQKFSQGYPQNTPVLVSKTAALLILQNGIFNARFDILARWNYSSPKRIFVSSAWI